nr:hypothetical protein [Tanacetum cinerariifolium]
MRSKTISLIMGTYPTIGLQRENFRCLAEVSPGSLSSVLLPPDRSQFDKGLEALDSFCNTFHIPEEVHLILPNQDDTIHERPTGKIRDPSPVATDFNAQDYATLVAHPSPFWKFLEAFLYLVGLSRHYTLDEDTYPRFVHKNEEGGCLLLCLCYAFYVFVVLLLTILLFRADMDLFAFVHASDPTKVRVVEREQEVDEPRLLDTIVGHTVPQLLAAPDCADSKIEASVERLFDEGGSGTQTEQGDSAKGGPDADIQPVVEAANIVTEDPAPARLRR